MTNTPESSANELLPLPHTTQKLLAGAEDVVLEYVVAALERQMRRHGILALAAHELRQAVEKSIEAGIDQYSQQLREKQARGEDVET